MQLLLKNWEHILLGFYTFESHTCGSQVFLMSLLSSLVNSYSCRGLSVCQNISRVICDFLSFLGQMLKVILIPDPAIAVWRLIKLSQEVMSESKHLY
jgi:hypothetical protein